MAKIALQMVEQAGIDVKELLDKLSLFCQFPWTINEVIKRYNSTR